jgi:hypothetical protein
LFILDVELKNEILILVTERLGELCRSSIEAIVFGGSKTSLRSLVSKPLTRRNFEFTKVFAVGRRSPTVFPSLTIREGFVKEDFSGYDGSKA